ncbi:hypothetical protein CDV36_014674 [Fusarium kuroshium]|uniref:Uncharacterized protein n=1 Tax=Fusarium kuroshium TaxID=2010991 RepID=A0A3M2RHN4_9HYPO|nr:hypothetical protein CDV36_014674 [Fusarium kuroshium]
MSAPDADTTMSLGDEDFLLSNTPTTSTTLLTVGDLPLGPVQDEDIASATRLCQMFNDHRHSMPEHVAGEILRRLKKRLFYHNSESNAPLSYITRVVSSRYGWDLSKDLRYKNGPRDNSRLCDMVTQMAEKLAELEERIHELEGGRDRRSRSRIRDAIHTVTGKAKGALKRTASSLTDRESLPPKVRRTSAGPSNEEEEVSQAFDMSFLKHRAAKTQWG